MLCSTDDQTACRNYKVQKSDPEKISIKQQPLNDNHNLNKMEKIMDRYGEKLKEDIQRMYPRVFSGLGKLEPGYRSVLLE